MKKVFVKLFVIASFFVTPFAFCGAAMADKIGFVNYAVIESESTVAKGLLQQIKKRKDEQEREINREKDDIESSVKVLEERKKKEGDTSAVQKEVEKLQSRVNEFTLNTRARADSMEEDKAAALQRVNDQIKGIVAEIAKARKLDAVLPATSTVVYNPKEDITADVIKELNKRMPSLDIKWTAPKKTA